MHWKLKARIQNAIAKLPHWVSGPVYYFIQRRMGSLRKISPTHGLKLSAKISEKIHIHGCDVINKSFFELGTGRRIVVPIGLWLLGAKDTFTVDTNTYLRAELIREDIDYIKQNKGEILSIFDNRYLDTERLKKLTTMDFGSFDLTDLLIFFNVTYIAPGDAAETNLPDNCIDYHVSNNVLEHIPEQALIDIFTEANRIVKFSGLFIHMIDYADHFIHVDKTVSSINFLQFSNQEWDKLSGNRFMYVNRLRVDDFDDLLKKCSQLILSNEIQTDPKAQKLLESGFPLHDRFASKSTEVLSTSKSWFVSKRRHT